MRIVFFISTMMYLSAVKGGQIDVVDCNEVGRGGGRFYSPSTGNKVGVGVVMEPYTADSGTVYYNISGFLQDDLTDGTNTGMYVDMSPYKNCRLALDDGLVEGGKAVIYLPYAEIDEEYPDETEDIYECKVLEWSGFGRRRLLVV